MSEGAFDHSSSPDTIFEIGLVMAGAISAGAYTAGVADFLIEALDEWDRYNKAKGRWLHEVKLRVISGASAGGMTGSILTAAFGGTFLPIRKRPEPGEDCRNPLYKAWVQEIDIKDLLGSEDVDEWHKRKRKIRELEQLQRRGKLNSKEFHKELSALNFTFISLLDSTNLKNIARNAI